MGVGCFFSGSGSCGFSWIKTMAVIATAAAAAVVAVVVT